MPELGRDKPSEAPLDRHSRTRVLVAASLGGTGAVVAALAALGYGETSPHAFMLEGLAAATLFLAGYAVYEEVRIGVGEALGLAGIAALLFSVSPDPLTRIIGSPTCEGVDSDGSRFLSKTEGLRYAGITDFNEGRGVAIRRNPEVETDYDVVGRLLPGLCLAGFDGFCIGEPIPESSDPEGPLDQLWFSLPHGRGFVSAAVVQELAPGATGRAPKEDCDGYEEPLEIEGISVPDEVIGAADFSFEAPNAVTVGVSAYLASTEDESKWHHVGLDQDATDGFDVHWDAQGVAAQADVPVVYSICWAGFVPGRAFGLSFVDVGPRQDRLSVETGAASLDQEIGRAIACSPTADPAGIDVP